MAQYPESESKILEFKERVPESYKTLIRECVALVNSAGGHIIIGVRDSDREIVGVTRGAIEKFIEDFPNAIHQSVQPTIIPNITTRAISGRYLIEITVPMGMSKPYAIVSEGAAEGIYIRAGSSSVRAKPEHIAELNRLGSPTTFDAEPIPVSPSILSERLLRKTYGSSVTEKTLVSERVLVKTTTGEAVPTRAAVLMFSPEPHGSIPKAIVMITHFKGTRGREVIRTADLHGPIPELIDRSISLVADWTEVNFRISGATFRSSSPIPSVALREVIANALIHRKYSIGGAVKISLYEDRIEILSPGDLPAGISIADLGQGVTDLRNPLIAKFARRRRIMEKLGSGISTACEACREHSLKIPSFTEGANYLQVTFFFEKQYGSHIDPQSLARQIAAEAGIVSKKDLVKRGVSDRTASKTLSDLVKDGVMRRVGRGPATMYLLVVERK